MTTPLAAVCCSLDMDAQAADLWTGCNFGCRYCLPVAREWARAFGAQEGRGLAEDRPAPRTGDPLNLRRLDSLKPDNPPPVFLSIMSDPYPKAEEAAGVTRDAIAALHERGVGVRILTKSGTRAVRDFQAKPGAGSGLGSHPGDAYGATLSFTNDDDSRRWEPAAALPSERIEGLREAHARGIPTWASLTPAVDPKQTLDLIAVTASFVDLFTIGRLEADGRLGKGKLPPVPMFDWPRFARAAVDLAKRRKTPCVVRIPQPSFGMSDVNNVPMDAELWRECCRHRRPTWATTSDNERRRWFEQAAQQRYRV